MKKTIKFIVLIFVLTFLVSLVISLYPTFNSKDKEDEPVTSVDFSTMTYVAFGDSITYGSYRNVPMEYPYPRLVSDSLSLHSYSNLGVSGATFCSNNFDRLCMADSVLAYTEKADIISVMLGVNDYVLSLPLGSEGDKTNATIYGSLYLIAEHLTTTQPDAFIFFMTPYKCRIGDIMCTEKNSAGYTLGDVAIAVKTIAAAFNIPVLDMYNEGSFELEMHNSTSDGVHPSPEFNAEYTAPQIVEFIKKNYK